MTKKENKERADQLLQEIRVVLPGTQALLGFQFIAFFNETFQTLSTNLQVLHMINLLFITISTILLISPVAFQELFENGSNTVRFLNFTSRIIGFAMFFLLIGLTGNVFVATNMLSVDNPYIPALASAFVFIFGFIMWFVVIMREHKKQQASKPKRR